MGEGNVLGFQKMFQASSTFKGGKQQSNIVTGKYSGFGRLSEQMIIRLYVFCSCIEYFQLITFYQCFCSGTCEV